MILLMREQEVREEAFEKGIEKGKKEWFITIARNMIKKNMDIESIIKITELTNNEVEELMKNARKTEIY